MMKKTLAALLSVTLLTLCLASALAYTGDVTVTEVRAFSDPAGQDYVGTIPAYTSVLVNACKNGVAQTYVNGQVVYVKASGLLRNRLSPSYGAGIKAGTLVYQRPSGSASSAAVGNTLVYVYAVKHGWALVRTAGKGVFGFVQASKLMNPTPLK